MLDEYNSTSSEPEAVVMTGFVGLVALHVPTDFRIPQVEDQILDSGEIRTSGFYCTRSVNHKFYFDKVFCREGSCVIITDGIFFNRRSLQEEVQRSTLGEAFEYLYRSEGMNFLKRLRGNFNGVIYDSIGKSCHIFSDPLGTKPVFYYWDESNQWLVFGSDYANLVECLRLWGHTPHLSIPGAYCLLTFGFMISDYTLVEGVKRLPPGTLLTYANGTITMKQYHHFASTPLVTGSNEEILHTLNELFRTAVTREFEKDREYGYHHIATLSGGLDSRVSAITAWKMGFRDILCFTFSQSGYLDEKIAKKIATDFQFDFLLRTLDGGNYLKDIEEVVRTNAGLILYSGAAHMYTTITLFNLDRTGMIHMGQMGNTSMGGFLTAPFHTPVDDQSMRKLAYSVRLWGNIPEEVKVSLRQHENNEQMGLYNRGINGAFNGYRAVEDHTEFSSAAGDTDFMEYALRIDPALRYRQRLYPQWIRQFLPEAAPYRFERTGVPINAGKARIFLYAGLRWLRRKIRGPSANDSMNPVGYWFRTNPSLKEYFDQYLADHINLLCPYPQLHKDALWLYEVGSPLEKSMVLTLLAALHIIIGERTPTC